MFNFSIFKDKSTPIKKSSKTLSVLGLTLFLSASTCTGLGFTLAQEGMRLKPYYDSTGVLTWCGGETEVGYKPEFEEKECASLFAVRYGYYSRKVASFYTDKGKEVVTPTVHAVATDLAYNIGITGVKQSSFLKYINQGNVTSACDAILKYTFAGNLSPSEMRNTAIRKHPQYPTKRYCKYKEHNCYGVWKRRLAAKELCLKGIQ